MRFETPIALLLLALLPLLFAQSRKPKANKSKKDSSDSTESLEIVTFPFAGIVDLSTLPTSLRAQIQDSFLGTIRIFCFLALVIALARPQIGSSFSEIETIGRDVVLALDLSGSMQAMDFTIERQRVTRLDALKYVVHQFVTEREGDRIGLVVFGDNAFTQCPLTLDHEVIHRFINRLSIGMAGHGTAIGDGLGIAIKRIDDLDTESKVIVLVTDGKNNSGSLRPIDAAEIAAQRGIKIHTVGIGSKGQAPFPTQSVFGRTRLVNRPVEYDKRTLTEIARITGGEYFNAKNTDGLLSVYAAIDSLEMREEIKHDYSEYYDMFFPFVASGLGLFLLFHLLNNTWFLRIP